MKNKSPSSKSESGTDSAKTLKQSANLQRLPLRNLFGVVVTCIFRYRPTSTRFNFL